MKATFFALLALAAAPALGVEVQQIPEGTMYKGEPGPEIETNTGFTGSVAARIAAALPAGVDKRAALAEFFCQLPTRAVSGAPANAANIDGVCITANECFSNSGARAFTGVCPGNTDCCIKNDCAGPNSNSACLIPSLPNDPLPNGESGRFVNGECPEDLRCFQLN